MVGSPGTGVGGRSLHLAGYVYCKAIGKTSDAVIVALESSLVYSYCIAQYKQLPEAISVSEC
jgi:hypothetical protein